MTDAEGRGTSTTATSGGSKGEFGRGSAADACRWSGGGCGRDLRRLNRHVFLRWHQDPQDGVDQDRAAGDDHEEQHEQQACRPRVDAEATTEARDHATEDPSLLWPGEALLGETRADVVHRCGTSLGGCRCFFLTPPVCVAAAVRYIGCRPDRTPGSSAGRPRGGRLSRSTLRMTGDRGA